MEAFLFFFPFRFITTNISVAIMMTRSIDHQRPAPLTIVMNPRVDACRSGVISMVLLPMLIWGCTGWVALLVLEAFGAPVTPVPPLEVPEGCGEGDGVGEGVGAGVGVRQRPQNIESGDVEPGRYCDVDCEVAL